MLQYVIIVQRYIGQKQVKYELQDECLNFHWNPAFVSVTQVIRSRTPNQYFQSMTWLDQRSIEWLINYKELAPEKTIIWANYLNIVFQKSKGEAFI